MFLLTIGKLSYFSQQRTCAQVLVDSSMNREHVSTGTDAVCRVLWTCSVAVVCSCDLLAWLQPMQSVTYEDDLDLLVVTFVRPCPEDEGYIGRVSLHDNETGALLKTIDLVELWDVVSLVHCVHRHPFYREDIFIYG